MKNMATNQKFILLMLITTFLMCAFQGVSHGGAVIDAVEVFFTGLVNVVAVVGAVTAGTVLIVAGAPDLGVDLIDSVLWHTTSGLSSMAVLPDGGTVGVIDSNLIHLGDSNMVSPHTTLTYDSSINSIAFNPNIPLLASGSSDNTVGLWDLNTNTLIAKLEGHIDEVLSVAFSPNGSLLASGSADSTVGLWDLNTNTLIAKLEGHIDEVLSVAFSPNGSLLASGSADNTIGLWDLNTNTLIAKLEGHIDEVLDIEFSPDGTLLASASADGLTGLWNLTTETLDATLGHESPVLSVVFSSDGDLLATGSADGVARLWDPHVPEHISTLGHESPVTSVAFDGNTLVSRSEDGAIRRWDITTSTAGSQQLESVCQVGDILSAGESCTYPGTDSTFSVLNDGRSQWHIPNYPLLDQVSIDGALRYTATINGKKYHFVATARSDGSWIIEEIGNSSDTGADQTPEVSESQPEGITASTTSPLMESTLDGSVVTLTLSGGTFERSNFRIRDAVTVSGIPGVTVGSFDIDRVSDTKISVELTFGGNINTDSTLTFTVGAGAIANYSGSGFTVQVPVASGSESLVASSAAPLTEATLNESVVTLTLSGRTFERSSSKIRNAITVSGVPGVTVRTYDIDRISDTEVTVELTFDGTNLDTNKRLTFTVEAGAIAGYDGLSITDQIPVTASTETIRVSTTTPLTETNLDGSVVTLTLTGRSYESSSYTIGRAITVSGIDGVTFQTYDVDRISDTKATVELRFKGHFQSDQQLTFTVGAGAIEGYNGPALTAKISVAAGPEADANNDGVVDLQDLMLVASNYGQKGQNIADVNGDDVVNIDDLTIVAGAIDAAAAAPLVQVQALEMFAAADVKRWLTHAQQLDLTDATSLRGIRFLEQLLAILVPKETALLPNYPNPFNPETWIPYRLAEDAFVTLTIYDQTGQVVRSLNVGHQVAAVYESRSKAVYWDGRNNLGEQVASGVYFYYLKAGDYSAMRKMLIIK